MSSLAHIIGKWNIQLLPSNAYCAAYTAEQASIGFAFESQRGAHAFNSDRLVDFWTRPNSLAYVPQGCAVTSESACGGEYLTFAIPNGYCAELSNQHRFNHAISPKAITSAYVLRKTFLSGEEVDPLEVEAQLLALLDVVEQVQAGSHSTSSAFASMTDARLKKIEELVEDELASSLTVEDLARCVNLSAGFLNRSFKAATGKTPHDFIIERRLARARRLLRAQPNNLSSVAYECGFSSHAHMSSIFKNRLGLTPSQFGSP
ncbi:AraC family transcriptional regulator [Pseudovibrio sp. Tun.PSC04-5.I4]|uniref:helix-turn-helix domain-containing protein n=1 Tax=Pseudovibrio sp. Tun.PSC04-5.I4 TaxID=1798213 RepID=UPI00088D362C|nr:AraC family transcriptional regulator [Pseudovibrio sp. Tun.PSC04-5.I4]SDQ24093.1 transcriptional regulator, AraC family [Pseudovibrio sp. Tun.PSC04-5.I4]